MTEDLASHAYAVFGIDHPYLPIIPHPPKEILNIRSGNALLGDEKRIEFKKAFVSDHS